MTVPGLLSMLKHVRRTGSDRWQARCPAHEDKDPSLSVAERKDGKILVHCFAGCSLEQISAALGIKPKDLFPGKGLPSAHLRRPRTKPSRSASPTTGLTLAQYAEAKGLPISFLRGLGLSEMTYGGSLAVRIPYLDRSGDEIAVQFRIALDGGNRFRWKSGSKPRLYGLWHLEHARAAGYVVLPEGPSDVQTLWYHDIPALGLPGANNWREERDANYLDGIPTIYLVVEPDQGGEAVKAWLARSSIRERVRLLHLDGHKDPSALYLADPDHFRERFQTVMGNAVPWVKLAESEKDARRQALWEKCEPLARCSHILDRLAEELPRCGVTGEDRTAKLLYLMVTTRFLERPVSAALTGPSASGKSHLTESVLRFFPPEAYYALSAMSERAMAYSEKSLVHCFLVLYEAIALKNDFVAYLVRSLLSEGRVRYETVEKTKDGLRARLIEREGPTGLLVTTTAIRLHPENETRLFFLPIADSP